MAKWKLKMCMPGHFNFIVQLLDEKGQVIPFASEAFSDAFTAVARAEFLIEHGHCVTVCQELYGSWSTHD